MSEKVQKVGAASARRDTAKSSNKKKAQNSNVNFSKAKSNSTQTRTVVVRILDVKALKTPEKYLNTGNILTVMGNYEKEHKGKTLLGDFLKDDSMTREERKAGAIKTFEILYQKAMTGAKTAFQKQELARLRAEFNKEVASEMDDSWFEWGISTSKVNEIVETVQKMYTADSTELAGEIFTHADDNHFSYADKDFRYLLESINAGNAIEVANKVKNHKNNKDHTSLLRILNDEFTKPFADDEKEQKKALMKNFVNSYFTAAGYKDSPYFDEAKQLLKDGKIGELESLMDSLLLKQPKDIASSLFKTIDKNSFALGRTDVKVLMDKVNSSNVTEVLAEFKKASGGKSLLTLIDEEWGDEPVRKAYISKITRAQVDASGFGTNKTVLEHVNASLKNESVNDIEKLTASLGKNKDIDFMSKTLFEALSKDKNNIDKEYVHYLLDGIDQKNVVKFLEAFNKLSGGIPITQFLQKKGDVTAQEYILSITDKLLDANKTKFENENFSTTFEILQSDVQKYIRKNIKDADDITRVVNSFLKTTTRDIAKNIEDIVSDKTGAADDISLKLWVSRINKNNAQGVIEQYRKMYDNETPINAIIEERGTDVGTRQKQILYILSAVVNQIGEDKVNSGIVADFTTRLAKELFGFGPASADKLNKHLAALTAGISKEQPPVSEQEIITPIQNVRPNIAKIDIGKKYGEFSWQYSNLKNIKSAEDVARFTGVSLDYINELKETEGYRKTAYKCSSNKKTIGIGHNFHNARAAERAYLDKHELSESEIYQILAHDIVDAINKLQKARGIDTSKLTAGQYEALVDVSFNAPNYMNTLSNKTNAALEVLSGGNAAKATKAFDEAAYEFNQQYSNANIASGLCKRRVRNILRYMGVKNLSQLPKDSQARKRIIILALNGYNASSLIRKRDYIGDICKILDITLDEFSSLEYPAGYKP